MGKKQTGHSLGKGGVRSRSYLQTGTGSLMQNRKHSWLKLAVSPLALYEWEVLYINNFSHRNTQYVSTTNTSQLFSPTKMSVYTNSAIIKNKKITERERLIRCYFLLQIPSFALTVVEDPLITACQWCTNASLGTEVWQHWGARMLEPDLPEVSCVTISPVSRNITGSGSHEMLQSPPWTQQFIFLYPAILLLSS